MEHYTAVLIVQMFVDVGTCFVIADLARRMFLPWSSGASVTSEGPAFRNTDRAPLIAFALAAVCPFFASYSSAALTECLAIFFAALTFDLALAALERPESKQLWIACGLAIAGGIFMRPDGGILLASIGAYLVWRFIRTRQTQLIAGLVLVTLFSLAPLIPWTIRNWRLYHLFQPLTPMAANAPDEFVAHGFDRWTRTWIADYSSLEDIGFRVPLEEIDIADLPPRAFDSTEQREQTEHLFDEYNNGTKIITPQLDFQFAQLADQRIRDSRFRYYVWLPAARLADLWLRPRTEMLPIDVHWWRYWDDPHDFSLALLLALINAFYLICAVIGAIRWRGCLQGLANHFAVRADSFRVPDVSIEPRTALHARVLSGGGRTCWMGTDLAAEEGSRNRRLTTKCGRPIVAVVWPGWDPPTLPSERSDGFSASHTAKRANPRDWIVKRAELLHS